MSRLTTRNGVNSPVTIALSPLRIAGIYTVFGLLALYVFDFFLPGQISGELLAQLQALKGAIEVLLTAGLIYVLTHYSERQLQQTNQRLEQFASTVSHDLRNPLNTMEGSLELAETTGDPEDFDRCRQAVSRMRRLIDDLLALAREGETIGDQEPVDLAAVVEESWATVETANATLVTGIDQTVLADESRLKQLFGNLVRNAIEHGNDSVTVAIGELDGGFYLEDDGPGIPENERDEVFDAGYSTSTDGTGFGLAIVREIADAHDWEIAVTESGTGGARFEIIGVEASD